MQSLNALRKHPGHNPRYPFERNRWIPHQSARQAARYRRQREAAETKAAESEAFFKTHFGDRPPLTPEFSVGTRVTWTSSGKAKTGLITHVVPPGLLPADVGAKVKDAFSPRAHESYVVLADGKTYWPRVSLLSIEKD